MRSQKLFPPFLSILLILFPASFASAEAEDWGTPYDIFFERNDLEPEYSRSENGEEKRSVTIPNQTRIDQTRKDGKVSTMASDITEHGAVLCAREIYINVKTALDNCEDLDYPAAQKGLETALQEIEKFVLENSIIPVSREDIEADDKRRNTAFRDQFPDNQPRICKAELGEESLRFMEHIAQRIENMSHDEFKNEIDKMLSVPRLPVLNPCL